MDRPEPTASSCAPPLAAPSGASSGGGRLAPWCPLLVVAAAWAAQGGVVGNGLVGEDGTTLAPSGLIARGLAGIPDLLVGTDGGAFRPVAAASLAVQASLHGVGDLFAFHLANLLLHGLAAVLYLAALHRLLPTRPVVVAAAALLFAAHPLHTGTVSWISARGDLLAAVFGLGALLAWTGPGRAGVSFPRAVGAGTLYLLACLSNEAALPLPGVLLVLDAARDRTGPLRALRARTTGWVALVVAFACHAALAASADDAGAAPADAPFAARSVPERWMITAAVLVRLAAKVFVPAGLVGDASNDPVLTPTADLPAAYAAATAVVALLGTALVVGVAARRAGLASVAGLAFFLLVLPVSPLVSLRTAFEDRHAYLPSLALLPLGGLAAERVACAFPRGLVVAAGLGLLGLLGAASWAAAAPWQDDDAFDDALLFHDPGHLRALERKARRLLLEGLAAKREADATPARDPQRAAWLARRASRVEESVRLLERARAQAKGRDDGSVLEALGDAYLALPVRRDADAAAAYRGHLERRSVRTADGVRREADVTDPRGVPHAQRRDLARVYVQLHAATVALAPDELDAHAVLLERATFWSPDDFGLRRSAAAAWKLAKRPDRALAHLERAVALAELDPTVAALDRATAARNLAETRAQTATGPDAAYARAIEALARPGGHRIALEELRAAVLERPAFPEAWIELAKIHKLMGNYRDAFAALDNAARTLPAGAPDDPRRRQVERLVEAYRAAAAEEDARGN